MPLVNESKSEWKCGMFGNGCIVGAQLKNYGISQYLQYVKMFERMAEV